MLLSVLMGKMVLVTWLRTIRMMTPNTCALCSASSSVKSVSVSLCASVPRGHTDGRITTVTAIYLQYSSAIVANILHYPPQDVPHRASTQQPMASAQLACMVGN